jgi:hypothetical protein
MALEEAGHPQPPAMVKAGNSVAASTANNSAKQKRSKATDMRFCWMHDPVRQGQFHICWHKGSFNKASCFSKHHLDEHHQQLRLTRLHELTFSNSNWQLLQLSLAWQWLQQ